jgi:hypothetical protein
MNEQTARKQKYKCPIHNIGLEESRGQYYCPVCFAEKYNYPDSGDNHGTDSN